MARFSPYHTLEAKMIHTERCGQDSDESVSVGIMDGENSDGLRMWLSIKEARILAEALFRVVDRDEGDALWRADLGRFVEEGDARRLVDDGDSPF